MSEETRKDEAAEFLRLSLPMMAKYAIPVTPSNYAVWFEYVSGANQPLRQSIDDLIESNALINEEVVRDLYQRRVTDAAEKRIAKTREALRLLLEDMGGTLSEADNEVSKYEASLAGHTDRLQGDVSTGELRRVVEKLSEETRSVRETGSALQVRLEESRQEAEALRKELEQARIEATTDALTGLANRKAFFRELAMMRTADDNPKFALVLLDIDHFKKVNDNYGHLLGDKVIRFVGSIMKNCVKGKDMVSRYGGEEFAILLPDTGHEGALVVAENIRASIEAGKLVRSDTRKPIGTITASLGVAQYQAGESNEEFIARADEALYYAKGNGRNQVTGEADIMRAAS